MSEDQVSETTEKYPIKILVFGLDDDELVIAKTEEQMIINKINFRTFTGPEEFLAALGERPDICFIDYKLKHIKLNGIEVTSIIMQKAKLEGWMPKVIMISGLKDFDIRQAFDDVGGWKWIHKGDDYSFTDRLISTIQEAIGELMTKIQFQYELDGLREKSRSRKKQSTIRHENDSRTSDFDY